MKALKDVKDFLILENGQAAVSVSVNTNISWAVPQGTGSVYNHKKVLFFFRDKNNL